MPHTQIAAVRAARRAAKRERFLGPVMGLYQLELDKLRDIAENPATGQEHAALCRVELRAEQRRRGQ
jgi:hypothetical protein